MPEGVGDIKQVLSWAGALSASAVIPHPIATFVGAVIGGLAGEVVEEGVSDFALLQQSRLLGRLRPLRNADLERAAIRALRDALRVAKRELQNQTDSGNLPRGLSDDEEAVFRKWDEQLEKILKVPDEQLLAATPNMPSDAPTLTALTKESLADTLLTQLRKLAESTTIPESLEHFLKAQLPAIFQTHYSEVLKDPTYNRAWIAFQRQMLEAIFQAIGELPGYIRTLIDEQVVRKQEEILSLLKAEPERWEQRAQKLIQDIKEPILEAIKFNQQQLDYIVELLGEKHYCRLLHEATLRFLDLSMQEVFVGREAILDDLEQFTVKRRRGLAVLFAPAGYGKTRLMMRLLARLQARSDIQTVYHFFTNHEALEGLGTRVEYAYAHLLLQLGALQGKTVSLPDANPDELRATLYYQLEELSRAQKPLVILIDGLDEADEPIPYPPLPEPLPDGVFVIVSARWDGQSEPPSYLQAWHKRANRVFSLETLREDDLREWLAREDNLRPYTSDVDFVRTLHQRTEGLPLYARYLIDDLRKAQDPRQELHDAPQGIRNYIRQQVDHFAQHVSNAQEVYQMFALLTVAKGAMLDRDIVELTRLSNLNLKRLPQPIYRWFLRSELGWQFQHPQLAAEFRRALPEDTEQMEQALLRYCAKWDEHKSPYALRYYAAHLAERAISDSTAAEHLYALMENGDFLQAQRAAFPDQPELPLSLLRQAIEVASARDEPVPLAKALLLQAQRVGGIRLQSPARIWRETGNLEYALKVADLYPPRMRPLWYLLLAREQPNPEQRKGILDRLAQQVPREKAPSPLLDASPYCEIAFALLIEVANDIDEATFVRLKPLFSEQNWLRRLNRLIDEGSYALAGQWFEWFRTQLELSDLFELAKIHGRLGFYSSAVEYAQRIEHEVERIKALCAIAKAQAQAGLLESARQNFRQSRDTAQQIEFILLRSETLALISAAQAETPELHEDAKETLRAAIQAYENYQNPYHPFDVDVDEGEINTLLAIAVAQLRLRSVKEARRTFERAIQIAKQVSEYEERNKAIVGIIQTQAEEYLLEDGLQNLEMIDWDSCRDMALVSIAKAQAQMELFADAREMVQKVEWLPAKIEILTTMAVVKARTGRSVEAQTDFQNAFRVVQMMESSEFSSRWQISEIAQAQAQAGFYDDSLITANMIDDYMSEALCTIAVAQAEMQLIQDALQTAQKIEHTDDRDFALFAISKEYVKEKKLGEAFDVAQRIEYFQYRTVALCTVAEAYFGEGNLGRAKEIYEDAHLAAVRIENELTRSIALHNISISQTRVGLIEDADRTKQSIPDDSIKEIASTRNTFILPDRYPYAGAHYRRFVYSFPDALCACAALMRAYPNHAREISAVVMRAISS